MTDTTQQSDLSITQTVTIDDLIAQWNSGDGKPYKGRLIDWAAWEETGQLCAMCAQGQVLSVVGGWSPERLRDAKQVDADKATAALLNISTAHAVLLRSVNDKADGAPSIVLTHPEKVLGDQAHIALAFWRHIDRMTVEQWAAVGAAVGAATRDVAWAAALAAVGAATRDVAGAAVGAATRDVAWAAALAAVGAATRDVAGDAVGTAAGTAAWSAAGTPQAADVAWDVAGDAAGAVAGTAAWAAQNACAEIQGARIMRARGQPFTFLPMFGFADPEAVLAAEQRA